MNLKVGDRVRALPSKWHEYGGLAGTVINIHDGFVDVRLDNGMVLVNFYPEHHFEKPLLSNLISKFKEILLS